MKNLVIMLSLAVAVGACSSQPKSSDTTENTSKMEKKPAALNQKEVTISGKPALVGEITQADLQKENYNHWYSFYKEDYQVNQEVLKSFEDKIDDFDIKIFIGTWCPDSQSNGPAFFKILEQTDYDMDRVQMFSLDRAKKSLDGQENQFGVSHVPTFVFLKDGKEVGRIVENPINSLEEDIRDIVQGNPQKPNYAD